MTQHRSPAPSAPAPARSVSPCPCRMAKTHLHGFIMEGDARFGMYLAAPRTTSAERWLDLAIGLDDGGTIAMRVWCAGSRVRACLLDPAESQDHPALILGHWMSERAVRHEHPDFIALVRNVLAQDARLRSHLDVRVVHVTNLAARSA